MCNVKRAQKGVMCACKDVSRVTCLVSRIMYHVSRCTYHICSLICISWTSFLNFFTLSISALFSFSWFSGILGLI